MLLKKATCQCHIQFTSKSLFCSSESYASSQIGISKNIKYPIATPILKSVYSLYFSYKSFTHLQFSYDLFLLETFFFKQLCITFSYESRVSPNGKITEIHDKIIAIRSQTVQLILQQHETINKGTMMASYTTSHLQAHLKYHGITSFYGIFLF